MFYMLLFEYIAKILTKIQKFFAKSFVISKYCSTFAPSKQNYWAMV